MSLGLCVGTIVMTFGPATLARSQDKVSGPGAQSIQPNDIIVTGRRLPYDAKSIIQHLKLEEIASFDATNIAELLSRVEQRLGEQPTAILVNGRRVASIGDLADFPPEALASVDILNTRASRENGFSSGTRVINLILKPFFKSELLEADGRKLTDGGGSSGSLNMRHVEIKGERRLNVLISLQHSEPLFESQRVPPDVETGGADTRSRTLLPLSNGVSISSSFAHQLGGVSLTENVNVNHSRTVGLGGPIIDDLNARTPVERYANDAIPSSTLERTKSLALQAGFSMQGNLRKLSWTMDASAYKSSSSTSLRASADVTDLRSQVSQLTRITLGGSLAGPVLQLPAGPLIINSRIETTTERASTAETSQLVRSFPTGQSQQALRLNADLPVSSRQGTPWIPLGDVSITGSLVYNRANEFKVSPLYSYGLVWSPISALTLSFSRSVNLTVPNASQLYAEKLVFPGPVVFDPTTQTSVPVSRASGGNPSLYPQLSHTLDFRTNAAFRIGKYQVALTGEYLIDETKSPIMSAVVPGTAIEKEYPKLFVRNAEGVLTTIDTTPFNGVRQRQSTVRTSLHVSSAIRTREGTETATWDIGVDHDWTLSGIYQLREDGLTYDLLRSPLDGSIASPRHRIQFNAAISKAGASGSLSTTWRSGSSMGFEGADQRVSIQYKPLWIMSAQGSISLPRHSIESGQRSLRLEVGLSNLFNRRPKVVSNSSKVPYSLQPGLLDPIGRALRLTVRKGF